MRRLLATSVAMGSTARSYRIIPHMHNDIEELAETQKYRRWGMSHPQNWAAPPTAAEWMCEKLNMRERRRRGILPEKSIARRVCQTQAINGKPWEPDEHHRAKEITITIVGYDGHPFHLRIIPCPDLTLNDLIEGSGIAYGFMHYFQRCENRDCQDHTHGEGCIINVDLDTIDKLEPPGRYEWISLQNYRRVNRGDIKYNTRHSCQIRLSEELDGAVFAMKQYWSRSLRDTAAEWGEDDNYATLALARQRRVEPWAPLLEEPTQRDFPITPDMLYVKDYETVLKFKYPHYQRKDGLSTQPDVSVAQYV